MLFKAIYRAYLEQQGALQGWERNNV